MDITNCCYIYKGDYLLVLQPVLFDNSAHTLLVNDFQKGDLFDFSYLIVLFIVLLESTCIYLSILKNRYNRMMLLVKKGCDGRGNEKA